MNLEMMSKRQFNPNTTNTGIQSHFLENVSNKLLVNYKANFQLDNNMDKGFEIEEDEELSFGLEDEEPIEVENTGQISKV